MRKLMFFLIGLLAVFNLISAYASYNNERYQNTGNHSVTEIVGELDNPQS